MSTIQPQAGPQTDFLTTTADIAIYGGAAGGGKSFGLLLEPLRHLYNPKFGGVVFRRNTTQIRNEGGLWDEAASLYLPLGATLKESTLEVLFSTGMRMKFAHLEHEKTVYDWQGSQIPFIGFDELTHFTEKQFFYMLSRNRSMSGVPGYVRATVNPDADSWVRRFISWWIDDNTGLAIKERAGVLRWFVRIQDEIHWADTREELVATFGPEAQPKSVTFIPSSIYDNKILIETDPSYVANLMALSRVERMRLLEGNWNVRPSAGMYFQKGWFEIVDSVPADHATVRYWDRAATKPSETNKDPDYTVGLKLTKLPSGVYIIADIARTRDSPLAIERLVRNTAIADTQSVLVGIEQDPGSAGTADAQNYVRLLAGYNVRINKPTQDKITRALAVSAQSEAGNVKVLRGPWNEAFFNEAENFPEAAHDDQVDALSGAFNMIYKRGVVDFLPVSMTGENKFKY